jgi:hypothetical protein
MITILKKNADNSFDVVSENEIIVGDRFVICYNSLTKEYNYGTVNKIHEQRKERGEYADESNCRMWAKVS